MLSKTYKEITPQEVLERIVKNKKTTIIDVRDQAEWESGHIAEAKHIPLELIPKVMNEFNREEEIIFVCKSGYRSGYACEYLSSQGYHVVNMTGGMMAWEGEVVTGK